MAAVVGVRGPDRADVPPEALGVFADFRMAQVKTMAFIIVMSRTAHTQPLVSPHRDAVAAALVRIMATVPDVLSVRKEALSCMRNMLGTLFKPGLQACIDQLLDERVLLGTSRACVEALRQQAYMTLAELVAGTKADLTLDQVRRVVRIFTRNAVDASNPPSLQGTSLRLLYNIIEVVFSRRSADPVSCEAYRDLLSSILDCMAAKLGALRDLAPRYICELKELEEGRRQRKEAEAAAVADSAAATATPPCFASMTDDPPTSTMTPMKPIANPSTRSDDIRSPSHVNATMAANNGAAAFSTEVKPAVRVSSA
jgi:transformation/transcription domain-associated protein